MKTFFRRFRSIRLRSPLYEPAVEPPPEPQPNVANIPLWYWGSGVVNLKIWAGGAAPDELVFELPVQTRINGYLRFRKSDLEEAWLNGVFDGPLSNWDEFQH